MKSPRKLFWRGGIADDCLVTADYGFYHFEVRFNIPESNSEQTIFTLYIFKHNKMIRERLPAMNPKDLMNKAETWMNEQYDVIESRRTY